MRPRRTVFATNHDMGSAQAMVPALLALRQEGYEVRTFAQHRGSLPDDPTDPFSTPPSGHVQTPAYGVFEDAGLEPECLQTYRESVCDADFMKGLFHTIDPSVVLVGVSTQDDGSEKAALIAAKQAGIPVVAIIESWPHRWLEVYGNRDIALYQQANAILLPDELSRKHMLERGFKRERLFVIGNPAQDSFLEHALKRDEHRSMMRQRLGVPNEAILVQWAVSLDLDDPAQDRPDHPEWCGFSEAESLKEFLRTLSSLEGSGSPMDVRGVIRQKPTHGFVRVRQLIEEYCPSVSFDNDRTTGIPLLLASDIVCGAVTLMVQQAAMLGVLGVHYFPNLNRPDPMITNRIGLTLPRYQRGDLRNLIKTLAERPGYAAELQSQVQPLILPTDATERVVTAIREFAR